MPTYNEFRGDCQPRRHIKKVVASNPEIGDGFTLTCNRKDLQYIAEQATLLDVHMGLMALINAQETGEFGEMEAVVPFKDDEVTREDFLLVYGPEDGTPIDLTKSTQDAGELGVSVTVLQEGSAPRNEIQRVTLAGPPTGGTFTLNFDGQITANINWNDNAATITTRLENLSNIAPGDVTVTGTAADFTVEFTGTFAGVNVPLLLGNGTNLTGGAAVLVQTLQDGNSGQNTKHRITENGFSWRVQMTAPYVSFGSSWIGPNTTASLVKQQIGDTIINGQTGQTIGTGNLNVTVESTNVYIVEWVGQYAGQNVDINNFGTNVTIEELQTGSGTAQNEVQQVTVINQPSAGTYTLTFSGQTTGGIAFDATAGAMVTALEALSNIGAGDVSVVRGGSGTLNNPYVYQISFQNALASTDWSQMIPNPASLTGSAVSTSTQQEAVAGVNEQQQISLTGSPSGGTYTLTWNPGGGGETTIGIAWNASAATVQSALEGLATPVPGDFLVTGAAGGPWIVEFRGNFEEENVATITGDGTNLTGGGTQDLTITEHQSPTGPNWINDPENWSLNLAPADGQTLVFENTAVSAKYGLDTLSGVTPAGIIIRASYTGQIGLPDENANGYVEYRPRYWRIGDIADAVTVELEIGYGLGSGSDMVRIDWGGNLAGNGCRCNARIYRTATVQEGNRQAVEIRGGHASSVYNVARGSLGIANNAGDEARLSSVTLTSVDNPEGDATVIIGPDVSLATIYKAGGYLELNAGPTGLVEQTLGSADFNGSAAMAALAVRGGQFHYNSSGSLNGNTIVSGDGQLRFDKDMRAKSIANPIDVYADVADVYDPNKVCTTAGFTAGDFVIDYNETTRQPNLGRNYRQIRRATA